MNNRLETHGYLQKITAWKSAGGKACRHGILFTASQGHDCHCMRSAAPPSDRGMWSHAKWMPSISHEMKKIIMIPFNRDERHRAGQLQAQLRRLNYM